jgi:hypothetical protein
MRSSSLGQPPEKYRVCSLYGMDTRNLSHIGKKVKNIAIQGKRKRGRPKLRWRDKIEEDSRLSREKRLVS